MSRYGHSRLLLGLGFALLASALGCGGGGGGSSSGGGTPPTVSVAVTSTSTAPTPTVTTGGTLTFTATVSGSSNTTVTWSVQEGAAGGSITSGGVYTAPATSGTYHVVATPAADPTKAKTTAVTVVAPAAVTSFTAAKATLTAGSSTLLTAVFTGGTGSVDHGIGTVSSGVAAGTGALNATTTFTLTVTNAAGDAVTAQATVTVVAAPVITSFTATPTAIGSGSSSSLTAVFTGGTGSVDQGVGSVTSGVAKATAALSATTVFTLTVTNAAGDFATAQATVTVYTAVPTITSFTATPATVTQGSGSTLAWSVSNATGVTIDNGVGAVASTGSQPVSPSTTTTYTLTATNPKGNATMTATVTVVFPPQITSFTASPSTVTPGSASSITPVFSQGTGTIDHGIGAVSSGTAYPTGALSLDTTYTLTVTNTAGTSIQQTLTVHVDPGTFSSTGNLNAARSFATSVPLTDGRVLILGGNGAGPVTAEIFDPAGNAGAGTFTLASGSLSYRYSFGATLLPDGKVLVVGGSGSYPVVFNELQIFDPATGAFTPSATTLSVPRSAPWVSLLQDGRVLIAGGSNDSGTGGTYQVLNSSELYDPATDTVSPTGNLGIAQSTGYATVMAAMTLPNGKVIIAGGGNPSGNADCEIYDPVSGNWTPGPVSLNSNWFTEVLLADGRVLYAGDGRTGPTCMIYDGGSNSASATGSLLTPSYSSPSATLLGDGRVLYAGDAGLPGAEIAADAELYDPATGQWKYTASPGDRGEQAAALLPSGKALLAGGFNYGGTGVLNTAILFDAGPAVAAPNPSATVTAPASSVTGTTGYTASVPSTSGARYIWSIQGGTLTAGQGTSTITFTAGAVGTLTLDCLVLSPYGMPGHGSASVTVTP
ncbi:MAG TPA: hypothetical protein VJ600_06065 [Holophagaceae bacterium]|nr:hypothetical protein [Holophagaceae bacterium]